MRCSLGVALLIAVGLLPALASGQQYAENDAVNRGPRFVSEPTPVTGERTDMSGAVVLRQRVTLDLRGVPLGTALDRIAEQAHLKMTYSPDVVDVAARVTLRAQELTVGAALTEVLLDAGVDVQISAYGRLALVRRSAVLGAVLARQGTGSIAGRVIDGATGSPLAQVTVRVDGSASSATTAADGRYVIHSVSSGTYHITARRVGYQPLIKDITLSSDQSATLDFSLTAAPTRLDEVVTTAVGQQRRYEVGNDISTINADSIAPTAPITSLTDLISARAPGVTVLENSGLTGSGEAIRIEGVTSLAIQSDPILIVDGVRMDNGAGGDIGSLTIGPGISHPTPTRLNDIDFSDIATIDILKGPAASTEYGTDAANGVIVITTKHGVVGQPQWRASAEQTLSSIPERLPQGYYSWGHTTDGNRSAVNCPVVVGVVATYSSTSGSCVVDSITTWNPLDDPRYTIFGTGNRQKYDLSVSGGSDAARYFVSGGLANERGIVQMPTAFAQLAASSGITLPGTAFSANTEDQRSLRATTSIRLDRSADVTVSATYLSTYQRTPDAGNLLSGVVLGPALRDSAHFYGYSGVGGASPVTPLTVLGESGDQQTDRLVGGLTANWRPTQWLAAHATAGLDHGSQASTQLLPPLGVYTSPSGTSLGQQSLVTDLYSVDVRATATAALPIGVRSASSAGVQMVDNRSDGQDGQVSGLTSTNITLNGYPNASVYQLTNRVATLGAYAEEEVTLASRLFFTGAFRVDGASGFGRAYSAATYPKASISWLPVDGQLATLRLRAAFGEAGVQPPNGASLQLYRATVIWTDGQAVTGNVLSSQGNPDLKPERTSELEGGADLGLWDSRLSLEITGYSKLTDDALVNEDLGLDLDPSGYLTNIGEVRNAGLEASLTVGLIQARAITWSLTLNGSVNHNRLVSLAPGVGAQLLPNQSNATQFRQAVGYPLYGIWGQRATYSDLNHDGIIEDNEVMIADSASYLGPSQPTQEASLATHISLWRGALTANALLDYRGGYRLFNETALFEDIVSNQQEGNVSATPLARQARYVAAQSFDGVPFVDDGTFVRFRELGVTYTVPTRMARVAHVQNVSLTAAVRNLGLWTRYSGVDPEVSNTSESNFQSTAGTGSAYVNNDIRVDDASVPLARYWVLRLTAGF